MTNGVSSGVRSIIDSFLNGLDILSKLGEKHKRKKHSDDRRHADDGSTRLSRSLRQGPLEIGGEYERGMRGLGERYARGDGIAQTSLAEILLRLNSGLVGIIASFLNRDRGNPTVDYHSLTDLSEVSRRDSLNVLRQLYQRMASRHVPAQIHHGRRPEKMKKSTQKVSSREAKIRGPTIARVTIEDSSKRSQLAVVKPKKKSPSSSSSNLTKVASHSSSTTAVNSLPSARRPQQKRSESSPALLNQPSVANIETVQQTTQRRSPPPASESSTGLLPAYSQYPPQQQSRLSPPMQRRPPNNQRRKDTPTMYSIATDSTKLGEVPLHKWAVPYDFDAMSTMNREAMQSGWPLVDLDGNTVNKPKKRFGLFRLFRKKEAE